MTTLAQRKAELDAMGGAEAFPYDARLNEIDCARMAQNDLNRLTTIPDRRIARWLYELYWTIQERNLDPNAKRRELRARHERLLSDALVGSLGADAKELAAHMGFGQRKPEYEHSDDLKRFRRAYETLQSKASP